MIPGLSHTKLVLPSLVVALGAAWLLNALDVLPRLDWIWTMGLAAAGVATLAYAGLNLLSAVIGPFLLTASTLSVLRQTGRLAFRVELPILVIAAGAYWFIGRVLKLPVPRSRESASARPE